MASWSPQGLRVFVCSPFRGDTPEQQAAHILQATQLLRFAVQLGHAPFAPHLLYPGALDDSLVSERTQGIEAGMNFLSTCQELWWLDTSRGVTTGMRAELQLATALGLLIRRVSKNNLGGFLFEDDDEVDTTWTIR